MLERARDRTRTGGHTHLEYARYADDLVVLVDGRAEWNWLVEAAYRRLAEEASKLDVTMNEEKTRIVDLARHGATFTFLGFEFRRVRNKRGKWMPLYMPRMKARTKLLGKLRDVFRRYESQPVRLAIDRINPILRGWVNYFRIGHASRRFHYVRQWVEQKVRRHMMRAKGRRGFGCRYGIATGGAGSGCTGCWVCSPATVSDTTTVLQHVRRGRSHNPWREVGKRA